MFIYVEIRLSEVVPGVGEVPWLVSIASDVVVVVADVVTVALFYPLMYYCLNWIVKEKMWIKLHDFLPALIFGIVIEEGNVRIPVEP